MATSARTLSRVVLANRQQFLTKQSNHCFFIQNRFLSCTRVTYGTTQRVNSAASANVDLLEDKKPGFMARMENKLETKYPRVYKVYILIKHGIKDFYFDTKTLYSVSTQKWKGKQLSEFSYNELDVYKQMPRDLLRVGPVVVLLNLPITDVVLPVFVLAFPRVLLSRHFWTREQQLKYGEYYLKNRIPHFSETLHCMDAQREKVTDPEYRRLLYDIIYKLEQKKQPSMEEILEVKPVFCNNMPFGRAALTSKHRSHLAKGLGFSTWDGRLSRQTSLLYHTDLAIAREGVGSLTQRQVQQACFLRGLNAANCTEEEAAQYLETWIQMSKHIDEETMSLLLHNPIFLAKNHPANSQVQS